MRILLVNHEFSMSGAAVMLLDLADLLVGRGHRVSVAAMNAEDGPLRAEYARRNVPEVHPIEVGDFDLVIVNTLPAAPAVIKLAPMVRTIWWIHESEVGLRLLGQEPGWQEAFDSAHRIVFPSHRMRDHAFRSFHYRRKPENVVVIPNGVRLEQPLPVEEKKLPWRVVTVGTVHAVKRQGDVVEALGSLGRDDIEYVMVGLHHSMSEEGEAIVASAPERYRILGQRSRAEALGWIASADVVIQPSEGESHALSLGEAASLARPLVLSDLQVFIEQGWRHGHNCLMQPLGSIPMLANNIAYILGNDGERLRLAKGSFRMRHGYRYDAFANRVLELIGGLVPAGRDAGEREDDRD